jgi:hypothetical protein
MTNRIALIETRIGELERSVERLAAELRAITDRQIVRPARTEGHRVKKKSQEEFLRVQVSGAVVSL